MKKNLRNIIIMLVVLAVLGGAAFLLTRMPAGGGEEASSLSAEESSQPGETVLELDEAEVESVEVRNQNGEFTAVPITDGDSLRFTLKGYEGYGLENDHLTSNLRSLFHMTAAKSLGPQENLEAFGLEGGGEAEVTIRAKSGDHTLILGKNAAETTGRYVRKGDEVYISSSVPANLYESMYVYFVKDVYAIAGRTVETVDEEGNKTEAAGDDIMQRMALSGTHYPEEVVIERSSRASSSYLMTEPVVAESGNTAFNELAVSLKSLTASQVVSTDVSEAGLKEHGLLEPEARIQFTLNDSSHELAVSAKDNEGNRYLLADENGVIYQVSNDQVSQWAEASVMGLRMSYIWIPNIKNVEKLTVTVDGDQVHAYQITRTKNEEKSTDSNIQYDLSITDGSGGPVDYEEAYQPFYQKMISLAVFSGEEAAYGKSCALRAEYEYFEGGGDRVEFYPIEGQNRYAALLNGEYTGQIRGTELEALFELIP